MYDDVRSLHSGIHEKCAENPGMVLWWLFGKPIEGMVVTDLNVFWCISGYAIMKKYSMAVRVWDGTRQVPLSRLRLRLRLGTVPRHAK